MKTKTQTKRAGSSKKKSTKPVPLLSEQGALVLVRTAVYHAIGVVGPTFHVGGVAFVRLLEACYIGDTGRYTEATSLPISDVQASEIEPVGGEGILDLQVAIVCDVARALPYDRKVR